MHCFRKVSLVIVIIGIFLLLNSCGRKVKKGPYLIGFSQYSSVEPIRNAMNKSLFDEAKKYSDILSIEYADALQDPIKQESDIEDFLKMNVDLLIVAPDETELITETVRKVYKSKIHVIVLDQMLESEYYTCFIGADNREIGREIGKYAAKILNGRGNIVEIQGPPGSNRAVERKEGFREIIDKNPEINIICTDFADWLRPLAITKMELALRAHEKIDLTFAHNDQMALGAYLASRSQGRENQIIFIGIGGLSGPGGGLQGVIDGKLNATFLYPTCGKEAIEYVLKILNGERVPKIIRLKTKLITKENAELFLE
ncbi:MAG: substrate-binding domain-containing protein [Candidatus Helarchaeota archaeon]|nr:substrate-binding domain-containing protein [Candidatus Helarchaeota archaeon]